MIVQNERVKNELRLLERALSATQSGVMITDATRPDDPIVFVNRAFERITGYAAEEAIGRNPRFLQAEHRDQPALEDLRTFRKSHNNDLEWAGVLRNYKKDGTLFYNELSAAAVRDESGRATHHVGVIIDVTDRERAEERLRFQARLLDSVGQAVAAVDPQGRIAYWNRSAEKLYGWPVEEVLGRPADEVLVYEDQLERAGEIWNELLEGRSWSGEFIVRRRDGTTFPVMVTDTPVHDEQGNLSGMIGVSTDIAERKRAEEALRQSEERYRTILAQIEDGYFEVDVARKLTFFNDSVCRILGYSRGDLMEVVEQELMDSESAKEACQHFDHVYRTGEPLKGFDWELIKKNGDKLTVEASLSLIKDAEGKPAGLRGIIRDVTDRRRAERELKESHGLLRAVMEGTTDAVYVKDLDGRYLTINPAGADFIGKSAEEIVGKDDTEFFASADARQVIAKDREIMASGEVQSYEEHKTADGVRRTYLSTRGPYRDAGGNVVGVFGVSRDITERKVLEERLEHQAFHDPLTGLPNRALFSDRLAHVLARGNRGGTSAAVLFMDLDNFKYVNDSLGHGAGDQLLVTAARRLERCVRPGDTVARLGGDEFAILLEGAEDSGDAIRIAQRVTEALRKPFEIGGRELFCGASVGIALSAAGASQESPEDLLRKADLALYDAKHEGKARYELFDPDTERRSMRRLDLENGLRRALERDELQVRYQPLTSLKSGRIVGFESLVRWENPERGLVLPDEFVPIAEENGLIVPIGLHVLEKACYQARRWQEIRSGEPPLIVGTNVSARQLKHPNLVEDIEGVLRATGLDPNHLTLEITESTLVEDAGRHADALRGLKELGVRFAIDDFGTGYSSLSYLRRLPAGMLKLDGSFIGGIGEGSKEDEVLLQGVIGIARGLGLVVCAEEVETAEQVAYLRELGCDLAQGNYFSEPLSSDEAARLLTQQ